MVARRLAVHRVCGCRCHCPHRPISGSMSLETLLVLAARSRPREGVCLNAARPPPAPDPRRDPRKGTVRARIATPGRWPIGKRAAVAGEHQSSYPLLSRIPSSISCTRAPPPLVGECRPRSPRAGFVPRPTSGAQGSVFESDGSWLITRIRVLSAACPLTELRLECGQGSMLSRTLSESFTLSNDSPAVMCIHSRAYFHAHVQTSALRFPFYSRSGTSTAPRAWHRPPPAGVTCFMYHV